MEPAGVISFAAALTEAPLLPISDALRIREYRNTLTLWIAARLAMGGSTYVSTLVNRLLRDANERLTLAAHGRMLDAQSDNLRLISIKPNTNFEGLVPLTSNMCG